MGHEPLTTWNLLLCTIAFPALGFFIKRELQNIQESAKERNRELKEEIAKLRDCISIIKIDLENKVDRSECESKSAQKWERIYHHRHTDGGEVVVSK